MNFNISSFLNFFDCMHIIIIFFTCQSARWPDLVSPYSKLWFKHLHISWPRSAKIISKAQFSIVVSIDAQCICHIFKSYSKQNFSMMIIYLNRNHTIEWNIYNQIISGSLSPGTTRAPAYTEEIQFTKYSSPPQNSATISLSPSTSLKVKY